MSLDPGGPARRRGPAGARLPRVHAAGVSVLGVSVLLCDRAGGERLCLRAGRDRRSIPLAHLNPSTPAGIDAFASAVPLLALDRSSKALGPGARW